VVDGGAEPNVGAEELERARIEAGVPAWGKELDDSVLPAEAGLDRTHISFTKGCYHGQEPVARLHYRGHANRGLRVLEFDVSEVPDHSEEIRLDGKTVGRVTSAARRPDGTVVALGYVRTDVPERTTLLVASSTARLAGPGRVLEGGDTGS
jgi:aminomethyltransferase